MTRQDKIRLRSFADRYIKIDRDIKELWTKKEGLGHLLQQKMEQIGVKTAEGTTLTVVLEKGDRITRVNSLKFYEAVPIHLQPKAWDALSVLVGKAQRLVGRNVLEALGKSVPFVRLVIRERSRKHQIQRKKVV